MDVISSAILGTVVSLVSSAVLSFVIIPPTRTVLTRRCSTGEGIAFWTRFTVLMLLLGPLIVTLVFGVPSSAVAASLPAEDAVVRIVTAALVGQFLALAGIGMRLGTLRARQEPPPLQQRRSDDELVR